MINKYGNDKQAARHVLTLVLVIQVYIHRKLRDFLSAPCFNLPSSVIESFDFVVTLYM